MDGLWTALCVTAVAVVGTFSGSDGANYANVAVGKPTQQISTYWIGASQHAVDGNRNPSLTDGPCTHTQGPTENTWWLVNLLATYPIHSVVITNRDRFSERLSDFYVFVSNTDPMPIPAADGTLIGQMCLNHSGAVPVGGPHTFPCIQPYTGQYVYIFKPGDVPLTICEFEIVTDVNGVNLQDKTLRMVTGIKSIWTPFYSVKIGIPSTVLCVATCLRRKESHSVQFQKSKQLCECIKKVSLSVFGTGYVLDNQWTLIEPLTI